MKFAVISCFLCLVTGRATNASDLYWNFDGPGPVPSAGWSGLSWHVNQGDLTTTHPAGGNFYGDMQTPPFRFGSSPSSVNPSLNEGDGLGSGQGGPVTTTITLSNFTCSPFGSTANCLVELIQLNLASARVATLSSGPFNGFISRTYTDPVIEEDGIYAVRFRAYDNDNPDTAASAADLQIKNATLAQIPARGDYNGDASVDAADYVVWRNQPLGDTVPWCTGADGNCNTFIDKDDYSVWRSHFGEPIDGSLAIGNVGGPVNLDSTVPEPATAAIFSLGLACALSLIHRRTTR